ncbi:hypothetical protein [Nocardioides renjunii]|uniref:hypothetical protein n=1 Tax=Nocardioides renjunii TaxID=3095075 RepID=UPI002AFE7EF5|nr:hypothetical protein [Nocardioides sp. S-34]WQQ20430.1 hypothetical protein SHK17_10960 [Nocardioides sp. S-34]
MRIPSSPVSRGTSSTGSIQFTGLLYSDWVLPALDHQLLLPMIAFGVVGGPLGITLALACYAPSYVVGWRLVQRARVHA